MLLNVYGDSLPGQTMVLQVEPFHSIARVKANILHLAKALGVNSMKFVLTKGGEVMSEGLLLSDYG
jgi:hypothetical protein